MSTQTAEPKVVRRALKGQVDEVNKSRRTITSVITTDAIDRYKEVIVPKGIRLNNFQENPVVLWGHNQDKPIGKNLWIKRKDQTRLVAQTLFAKTDRAMEIFELYAEAFLNGWSIGAMIDWESYSPPTPDEIKARKDLAKCRRIIRGCELVEYSAVSIPANPEALGNELTKSLSKSLRAEIENGERWDDIPEELERGAPWDDEPDEDDEELGNEAKGDERKTQKAVERSKIELPPLVGRSFAEVAAEQRNMLRFLTSDSAARRSVEEAMDRLKGRP